MRASTGGRGCLRVCVSLALFLVQAKAAAVPFWTEHAQGWHWYQDPLETKEVEKNSTPSIDPVAALSTFRARVARALDQAIVDPTPAHLHHYIALQNRIMAQAHRFARAWQAALLNDPTLDYSIAHPTNALGSQVYADQRTAAEDAAIYALAQHSGLFFFYRSNCPYCQRSAPRLKAFADRYGIALVPVTLDGTALPEFPHSLPDRGQAARFSVTVVPALFTVDPYQKRVVPVGYGILSEDELRRRILMIATRF